MRWRKEKCLHRGARNEAVAGFISVTNQEPTIFTSNSVFPEAAGAGNDEDIRHLSDISVAAISVSATG